MKDKIDTQGLSIEGSGSSISKVNPYYAEYPPFPVVKHNIFNDREREELKEIFHEVLAEYGLVKLKTK